MTQDQFDYVRYDNIDSILREFCCRAPSMRAREMYWRIPKQLYVTLRCDRTSIVLGFTQTLTSVRCIVHQYH
jgi:hypothetical protein